MRHNNAHGVTPHNLNLAVAKGAICPPPRHEGTYGEMYSLFVWVLNLVTSRHAQRTVKCV